MDKYAEKGSRIYVEGVLGKRTYIDKNGQEKMAVDIIVNAFAGDIHLIGNSGSAEEKQEQPRDVVTVDDMPF